jgi:hypothetical protein
MEIGLLACAIALGCLLVFVFVLEYRLSNLVKVVKEHETRHTVTAEFMQVVARVILDEEDKRSA